MAVGDLILRRIAEISATDLQPFTCGSESLDEFLKEQALPFDQSGLTFTTVVFAEGTPTPVAYFSLSSDNLKLSNMEEMELGLNFQVPVKAFPAVKITRLAVASDFQSQRIGESLIELIEGLVFESAIAARLITVDADNNDRTVRFYQRLNFVESSVHAGNRQNEQAQRRDLNVQRPATISLYKDIYVE